VQPTSWGVEVEDGVRGRQSDSRLVFLSWFYHFPSLVVRFSVADSPDEECGGKRGREGGYT
jgi:hypothetical protein